MGKHKGNSFENKTYKDLRKILPDLKLTIGSGNSERDADLTSDKYVFELKHYKKLSDKQLEDFFIKVFEEAMAYHKIPILIYKENYKPIKVMMELKFRNYMVSAIISYEDFKGMINDD